MDFSFKIKKKDKNSRARAGVIKTPHGSVKTPAFSPVGTKATVKGLSVEDLREVGSQAVLANTYHLYLQPGPQIIEKFGGFGKFMNWTGPTITDSGGYQVSFLFPGRNSNRDVFHKTNITDKGMYFYSHIDGSKHLLTPEISMDVQKVLAADIIMALDQPMGDGYSLTENQKAFERTFKWEERSFSAWKNNKCKSTTDSYQALFGIIQGQTNAKKRIKSLKFLVDMGFPGLAIGGQSIGSNPKITAKSLDTIVGILPDDKPLHALGLGGGPEGIFEAVARGVDMFDNSSVTRMARTGLLYIYPKDGGRKSNKFRLNIKSSKFAQSKKPISSFCKCYCCQNYSRAYVNHLIVSKEILGARLATIHNVHYINDLMSEIRQAINRNDFINLKKHWLGN